MNHQKYSNHAKDYEIYRTDYPTSLYDYLHTVIGVTNNSILADIGSGTGKLSRTFIQKGNEIFCIEPNNDMRNVAEELYQKHSNFHSLSGTAEATGLPDHSVDFVMAGTAFHWFSESLFREECKRILKPNGKVLLVWISRPLNYNGETFLINNEGRSGGKEETPELFESFFLPGTMQFTMLKKSVCYDKEHFINRGVSTFDKMNSSQVRTELAALFDRNSVDEKVVIPCFTRCISGSV